LNEAFRRFLRSGDLLAKATKLHVTDAYINYAQVHVSYCITIIASRITVQIYSKLLESQFKNVGRRLTLWCMF